jgi:hypothetical protein
MLRNPTPCRGGWMSSWLTRGTISTLLSGVAHFLFGLDKEFFSEATTKPKVQLAGWVRTCCPASAQLMRRTRPLPGWSRAGA